MDFDFIQTQLGGLKTVLEEVPPNYICLFLHRHSANYWAPTVQGVSFSIKKDALALHSKSLFRN